MIGSYEFRETSQIAILTSFDNRIILFLFFCLFVCLFHSHVLLFLLQWGSTVILDIGFPSLNLYRNFYIKVEEKERKTNKPSVKSSWLFCTAGFQLPLTVSDEGFFSLFHACFSLQPRPLHRLVIHFTPHSHFWLSDFYHSWKCRGRRNVLVQKNCLFSAASCIGGEELLRLWA